MKLFLKIVLFIFTMNIITAEEAKSSTVVTILKEEIAETDPTASQIANLNDLDYGGNRTTSASRIEFNTIKLDFTVPENPIAELDPVTGETVIYDTNGEPHVIATQQNGEKSIFPMVVEDKDGNKYQIDQSDSDDPNDPTVSGKQPLKVTPIKDISGSFDKTKLNAADNISMNK